MSLNFGGIPNKNAAFKDANILLQSVPYDGTSTWGKGADVGFEAFLDAAENMELYDIETDSEVYTQGIHILPSITEDSSPEKMTDAVYASTKKMMETGKFFTLFGGEHSISIGAQRAFYEKHPDITVLQLDAHADLRPEYEGSACNHACAVHQASLHANLVQIGIRSMDVSEKQFLNKDKCFFAHQIRQDANWMTKALDLITDKVYLTIDLDAFDPSIMPATGTPEPGGLLWHETLTFLKMVFEKKNVLAMDMVELAPIDGLKYPEFMAAKLYYKLLSYKFYNHDK